MAAQVNFSNLSLEELQRRIKVLKQKRTSNKRQQQKIKNTLTSLQDQLNKKTKLTYNYTKADIHIDQGRAQTTAVYKRSNNKSENPTKYIATGRTTTNELKILEELQECDKVMQISNKGIHNGQWKIFTPYKSGGDLMDFMIKHIDTKLDDVVITDIIRQIIEALVCIHKIGFAHLDFKSENIVIDEDNKITIIDFETARKVDEKGNITINEVVGTKEYISPELQEIKKQMIERKIYRASINGFATDIYTISVIVLNMALLISKKPSYYNKFITYIEDNYTQITAKGLLDEFDRQFVSNPPKNASNASIVYSNRNEPQSKLELLRAPTQNKVTKGKIDENNKQLERMGGRRKSYKKSKKQLTKKQRKQRTYRA
jgi:serine/threonine protein kinase